MNLIKKLFPEESTQTSDHEMEGNKFHQIRNQKTECFLLSLFKLNLRQSTNGADTNGAVLYIDTSIPAFTVYLHFRCTWIPLPHPEPYFYTRLYWITSPQQYLDKSIPVFTGYLFTLCYWISSPPLHLKTSTTTCATAVP